MEVVEEMMEVEEEAVITQWNWAMIHNLSPKTTNPKAQKISSTLHPLRRRV